MTIDEWLTKLHRAAGMPPGNQAVLDAAQRAAVKTNLAMAGKVKLRVVSTGQGVQLVGGARTKAAMEAAHRRFRDYLAYELKQPEVAAQIKKGAGL